MIDVPTLMVMGSEVKGLGSRELKEKPEVMTRPTFQTNPSIFKSYVLKFFQATSNNQNQNLFVQ